MITKLLEHLPGEVFLAFLGGADLARIEIAISAVRHQRANDERGTMTEAGAAYSLKQIEPRVLKSIGPCISQDAIAGGWFDIGTYTSPPSDWTSSSTPRSAKAFLFAHELYLEGAAHSRASRDPAAASRAKLEAVLRVCDANGFKRFTPEEVDPPDWRRLEDGAEVLRQHAGWQELRQPGNVRKDIQDTAAV